MTWHFINVDQSKRIGLGVARFAPRAHVLLLSCALLAGAGCSSSKNGVSLEVTAPAADAMLTSKADDKDLDMPGVQFDVAGKSKGIPSGTAVELFIDDMKQAVDARAQSNGNVDLAAITLPPGTHKIYLRTATGSATSNRDQKYTLKAIVISSPDNGAIVTKAMDEDSKVDGIQISVTVNTYAVDSSQKVTLFLDGQAAGSAKPDAKGKAVVSGVTLLSGKHTLLARIPDGSTTLDSSEVKVTVQESCAAISFVSPAPPAAGQSVTLGGAGKCPANAGGAFTAPVQISTDAGNGRAVHVIVNGQTVVSGTVNGASASFDAVAFNKRMSANTLEVQVENANGDLCTQTFPADILVDCAGPDCSIASPTPVPYVDGSGKTTLYLNHAKTASGGQGFDIQVASSSDIIGRDVQLIIDGDSRKPLTLPAVADGTASSATFAAVGFSEGAHRVEALCTDGNGNVTSSGELEWVVDTQACGVDTTDPAGNTVFVPGDDTDSATSGTQVVATSTVTGSDCVGQRSKVCDPAAGITGADFGSYAGTSPLLSTITLSDAVIDQSLCVEVQDQARNVGRSNVAVSYRSGAPVVSITSPATGTKYNAQGGTGYVVDADRVNSPTACDAVFDIACSEEGVDVELHHDSAAGAVFAHKACVSGNATITALFEDGDDTAVIVATQTVAGSSTKKFVGESAPITLKGDCNAPGASLTSDPCASVAGNQLTVAQAASRNVTVQDSSSDTLTATLTVTNGSTTSMPAHSALTANLATYTGVDLGGVGTVTVTATTTDDYANTTTATCTAAIVDDLPQIVSFLPADGATFGPGQGCNAGGQFGVQVQATIDKQTNRTVSVSVNGTVAASNVPITAGGGGQGVITVCVPVPDNSQHTPAGPSTITLSVAAAVGTGAAQQSHSVKIHTVSATAPADNATLVAADNCAGTGFGYNVTVAVDPSLDGMTYTLASGAQNVMGTVSGSQISGCVPLAEGPNTITVTIDGNSAPSSTLHVTVVNNRPSHGIVIDNPTFDTASVDYRKGTTATWLKPVEDWAGQLVGYQLRCSDAALANSATDPDKQAWWNAATAVTLPGTLLPEAQADGSGKHSALLAMRPAEPRNCVLRAGDAATPSQLTPIVQSTDLTLKLRQALISSGPSGTPRLGLKAAAVGDVDGDGTDDMLVGGTGRAELIFGTTGDPTTATKVVFTGTGTGLGAVAGLGDFNGDGRNDFAIGNVTWNSNSGQVSIFFGRPRGQWNTTTPQDIESTCNADLCIEGSSGNRAGRNLATIGDFDNDGRPDLALGSQTYPAGTANGQLLVLLGGKYQEHPCTMDTNCRATETCDTGTSKCVLGVGETFWKLRFSLPSGNWVNPPSGPAVAWLNGFQLDSAGAQPGLGAAVAGVGVFDANTGTDLVVSAPNVNSNQGQVHYLSGRAHSGTTGFDILTTTDLGLPGQPAGTAIAAGAASTTSLFGTNLGWLGDFYDVPGAVQSHVPDLAICASTIDEMYVQPGDRMASGDPAFSAPRDTVSYAGSNIGTFVANSQNPIQGLVGDLDLDGRPELLLGTRISTPRDIVIWYPDRFAAAATISSTISPPEIKIPITTAVADSSSFVVQYIGDFNHDGYLDALVGDSAANTNKGQITLLY